MALPILTELEQEITRLTIAGSPLAKGDPRLKKYIPALGKLGEKVPVFAQLAERVTTLTECDEKSSPEALMSVNMLLSSVMFTQGSTDIGAEIEALSYAERPLAVASTPYSQLSEVIRLFELGSGQHSDLPKQLYEQGRHRDPRLFAAYITSVTDAKSYISDFVCATILPDLGEEILPFLLEEFDPKGSKRHARILRVLAAIQKKDVLPLAETALAEGEPFMMAEALRAMGQDQKYEDTLLSYAKDRKSEIREAAFAGLSQIGSQKGDKLLLEGLKKASIAALEEALVLSANPEILAEVLAQTKALKPDYKKSGAKLRILLRVLAARPEPECLALLEDFLGDKNYRAEAFSYLEVTPLLESLRQADTPEKNEMLLRISQRDESMIYYKLTACVRLFSKEEVYERCHKDISVGRDSHYLVQAYGLNWNEVLPDAEKPWDRRWGEKLASINVNLCRTFLFDDDKKGWRKLLEHCVVEVKRTKYAYDYYAKILAGAFLLNHPDAAKFFSLFVKAGFDKARLVEIINREAPDVVLPQ